MPGRARMTGPAPTPQRPKLLVAVPTPTGQDAPGDAGTADDRSSADESDNEEEIPMRRKSSNGRAGRDGTTTLGHQIPGDQSGPLALAPADLRHLEEFEKRLQVITDRVTAVALGYSTGLFLWGPGGVSKSFTVERTLKALQVSYKIFNSRRTGWGLFERLKQFPDSIHVLEDLERIMRDTMAQGVLRSALWGQKRDGDRGPQERLITWNAHRKEDSFIFAGGIILISNRDVLNVPEWQAIATRIAVLHLQPSDSEMRALMRRVAIQGYEHDGRTMDPAECMNVCEYIIEQAASLHVALDMRLLVSSFHDYLQWLEGDAAIFWQDQVASRVRKRPVRLQAGVSRLSRADRKREEQRVVRDILHATDVPTEQVRLWAERTEKSQSAFYRRKAEIEEG